MRRFVVLSLAILITLIQCSDVPKDMPGENSDIVDRLPVIYPDYTATTFPPNIAPPNFIIQEDGEAFFVRIKAEEGEEIRFKSQKPVIDIPQKPWQNMLDENRGKSFSITVFAKSSSGEWTQFSPIENKIADKDIDSHLVYRIIPPLYQYYNKMGIYQRNLQNYKERTIAYNKTMGDNCVNCHSFHNYNPDRMIFHMRAGEVGTAMMMIYDGEVRKIDTKTEFNHATSYRSWHPNGEKIAFAFNTVKQMFHAIGENRDVYDRVSDLVIYDIKTGTISTTAQIATPERFETYPEWSPDGKYLYFCSADGLDSYEGDEHPYKKIKYDLMRIPYDVENNTWGDVEPVVKASDIGLSVAHAKPSPDGKYILFCMSEYSYFPLYKPEADLYLLNTATNEYRRTDEINSDQSESYHSWSSNGHWVVFSSKRRDGLCTDPYFSYFDGKGTFSKPFLLPQQDPELHQKLFRVYNIPEFTRGPITTQQKELIKAAWDDNIVRTKLDANVKNKTNNYVDDDPIWVN